MYSVKKDGIEYIVEDKRKEEFEKKGYTCEYYVEPISTNLKQTKKTKGEQ